MVYKFKVTLEDYENVVREIEIKSTQTFYDLYIAIMQALAYKKEYPGTFFISNDNWTKGKEIGMESGVDRKGKKIIALKDATLHDYIIDPHQKIYFELNAERFLSMFIELRKISADEPGKKYPVCILSKGTPPHVLLKKKGSKDEADEGAIFDEKLHYDESEELDNNDFDGEETAEGEEFTGDGEFDESREEKF